MLVCQSMTVEGFHKDITADSEPVGEIAVPLCVATFDLVPRAVQEGGAWFDKTIGALAASPPQGISGENEKVVMEWRRARKTRVMRRTIEASDLDDVTCEEKCLDG